MKKQQWNRVVSMLVLVVMVILMIPSTVVTALAESLAKAPGMPEMLVTSLTELYRGDEARAKEDLEAMRVAGLIDENGKMTDLDIREDGKRVELSALAERIAGGEDVGAITVNGRSATPEQVLKISQVSAAIEIADLLAEEIEVTDGHVSNLKDLVRGILNGDVDLNGAIRSGSLRLNAKGNAQLQGTDDEPQVDYTLPENTPQRLTLSEDGNSYYAPYVSGSTYNRNYPFAVNPDLQYWYDETERDTYYTDKSTSGAGPRANSAIVEGNIRRDCFDWEKAIVGVDENRSFPTVTAVLPLKSDDAVQNMIATDMDEGKIIDFSENGIGIEMELPRYGKVNLKYYFGYMYFAYSPDGSITSGQTLSALIRYPVYLVEQAVNGSERVVAVATRFVAPVNLDTRARLDTLSLYVDPTGALTHDCSDVWTAYPEYYKAVPHVPDWSKSKTDVLGYRYWNESINGWGYPVTTSAIPGRALRYFVPSAYVVRDTQANFGSGHENDGEIYQIRPEGSWEQAANGFIKLKNPENPDFPYVQPVKPQYPERQYDAEIMITEQFYDAIAKAEVYHLDGWSDDYTRTRVKLYLGQDDLRAAMRISDRLDFSVGSNGKSLKVKWTIWGNYWEDYFRLVDTSVGNLSMVTIIPLRAITAEDLSSQQGRYIQGLGTEITALNGEFFNRSIFGTDGLDLHVYESDPFLSIPKSSRFRQTNAGVGIDVLFSTNLPQHDKGGYGSSFRVELYKVGAINANDPDAIPENAQKLDLNGRDIYYVSSGQILSHISIPGSALNEAGYYAVKISTEFNDGIETRPFSAVAWLTVKPNPVKIRLGKIASASVDTDHIPSITYTLENATESTEVKYTIQPSGEAVSAMTDAEDGRIPFAPDAFEGLRKAYTVTVYARNKAEDPWSVDSMLLTVYNNDVLKILIRDIALGEIGGSTGGKVGDGTEEAGDSVNIDNNPKVAELVDDSGEGSGITISGYDFDALRADLGLQRVISVNYGSGVWGTISDRMRWTYTESDGRTSNSVTLNHKENGSYADLRNYSYTAYIPTTDFLIVATEGRTEDAPVTVTAVHATTGMTQSVRVTVSTLQNKLYLFRFQPKATTYVTYKTGKGETRQLHSKENGELIVYEPDGIASEVVAMCRSGGETYVGTIQNRYLVSGEKNIAKLELYPCNNLKLAAISSQTLTILKPDGKPYTGKAILRAGIYKGGEYCPTFGVRTTQGEGGQILREDVILDVTDGKAVLYYDPTQLTADDGLQRGIRYVYEYRVEGYQPGYTIVDPTSTDPADSMILLKQIRGNAKTPQIIRQEYQQYYDNDYYGLTPTAYIRNVIDYQGNIGISPNFPKSVLYTDIALPGETVGVGEDVYGTKGYSTYEGTDVVKMAFYTTGGKKLTGQTDLPGDGAQAVQITDLYQLEEAACFVFPFSAIPIIRSTYVMTDADMRADGIDDTAKTPTARVKAVFTRGALTVANLNLPFGVTNVSNQPNLSDGNKGAAAIGKEVRDELAETSDIGAIFRGINVNDMIRQGFLFLGNLKGEGGDNFVHLMILPTEDPAVFRIVAFVGADERPGDDDGDGVSINYNPNDLAEDVDKLRKELEESSKKKDSDSDGEGSMKFNFYGTLILEARAGVADGKWGITFRGGNVGTNVSGKYEWGQTFMCGPYPAFISFEVGFHADLEVAFGNKGSARAMLLDAALGVSIEAFAGLGFDLSIVALQIGIYGQIGADVDFLLLTPSNAAASTGTKLTIAGEIGIKLKVKLLFVSYSKNFASTGFNWTKKWNKYDQIKDYWTDQGYGELSGVTKRGRAYTMYLFADGSAMVAIDGGAELESRDYLELEERIWTSGAADGRRLLRSAGTLTDLQTNAYPYSHPVFTDDGGLLLYISDNGNAKKVESVTSYAVGNGEGYEDKGRVDPSEENILADLDVVASGTKENAFAAWVKQVESPRKENGAAITDDDLGMMFNATEIYASSYVDGNWTTERLTDNFVADMSPTVASSGNRAIVAWRSMTASTMSAGGAQDITAVFDVENNINYRIYNGTEWTAAKIVYNGSAGSVNAVDSAMLSDGTAIVTYTVRTGEDVTATETFYTVIGADGEVLTTGRLTNDDYTDTGVQATAVNEGDGYFVLGWYSEHDAGEGSTAGYDKSGNASPKAVVAHDIRLACIRANGSYDVDFPESLGGTADTGFTSDFAFSAPVGNTDLTNVSVVWSQRMNSDGAADAGKYELNAVRFFRTDDLTGVTAPAKIAVTPKNYTIDRFDVYTDGSGAVHAVLLGSDYDHIEGIGFYDSIDLNAAAGNTNAGNSDAPSHLNILDGEAICSLKLATGRFPEIAADVIAETNIHEVIPGFSAPVRFTVTNKGTEKLASVTAAVGSESRDFTVDLLPGRSATVIMNFSVPEGSLSDPAYAVTSGGTLLGEGQLVLNRPDVGISGIRLLREYEGKRDVQVTLANSSSIPLAGSGKTVKLAFYADPFHTSRIGEEITVSAEDYAQIDRGVYTAVRTVAISDLYTGEGEIPDGGLTVYAHAWVEETEEPNLYNNDAYVSFRGLVARNNGAMLTADNTLDESNGEYTVTAYIRNNSIHTAEVGIPVAVLLDSEGNILARKNLAESLTLGAEEQKTLSADFTATEIGTGAAPASADIRFLSVVSFDVNGGAGEFSDVPTDLDGHITLPAAEPTAPVSGAPLFFRGWYTAPTGGEQVTEASVFHVKTTVYARYTEHEHIFEYTLSQSGDTVVVKCVSTAEDDCPLEDRGRTFTLTIAVPQRAASGYGMPDAKITGDTDAIDLPKIRYYQATADGAKGDELTGAPVDPGKYRAELPLGEGDGNAAAYVVYEIPAIAGVSRVYASVPEFVKATDLFALNDLSGCTALEAWAWIYANEDLMNTSGVKYIVYGKGYMTRPEDTPEEYWPYDANTEYAFCIRKDSYRYEEQTVDFQELRDRITDGSGEVYVVGTGRKQMLADAKFDSIWEEDVNSIFACSELDGLLWILANVSEKPSGIMILRRVDDYRYRMIEWNPDSVRITTDRADYAFYLSRDKGLSVYGAQPIEGINPYKTYPLTFDANGGTGTVAGVEYYVKSVIGMPDGEGFSRPNLAFDGWNTKADGTGDAYRPGDAFEVLGKTVFYAQWKHLHHWSLSYDGQTKTFTATCDVPDCPHSTLTLHPEPVNKTYDGKSARPYVCSEEWTAENGLPVPTVVFYRANAQVADAISAGAYTALVSLDGHDVEVGEFSIAKRPVAVIVNDQEKHEGEDDPEFTASYDAVSRGLRFVNDASNPWQIVTEGERTYVKSGNSGKGDTTSTLTLTVTLEKAGTLSFDYRYGSEANCDKCYFRVDGKEKFNVSGEGAWTVYSVDLTAGKHTLTWSYSKDGGVDRNGDFFAVDNVAIASEGSVTQVEKFLPFDCLNEGLFFENDTANPWTEVTEGERTYVKSAVAGKGNAATALSLKFTLAQDGKLSFDYSYGSEGNSDFIRFFVDGNEKFKFSGEGSWTTFSVDLTAGTHTLTWSYTKDHAVNENGDFFAVDNVVLETAGEVTQEDPDLPMIRALNKYEGGLLEGDTLNYTFTREEGETEGKYAVTVIPGENANYEIREIRSGTLSILEALGEKQTIEADDLTVTYGDTGVKIHASVTVGEGTLSYKVKSGNAVSVDDEGNLTILKVGTAVITVTASRAGIYARTAKDVTVTVAPKAMTIRANDVTVLWDGQPHGVTVTAIDPAEGYTVRYGFVEGDYVFEGESPTLSDEESCEIYYQVTAENYITVTGSVLLTITRHAHDLTYAVGTGEHANTVIATCSAEGCPFPESKASLILNAPTGRIVYDGAAHPAVILDENGILGDAKILYFTKGADGTYGAASDAAPIAAGTYRASLTLGTGENAATVSVEYEIGKAELTDVSVSQSGVLTYNGEEQTPQVITAATSVHDQTVTFTYSLTEDGEYGDLPTFTDVADAGTVYFKASAPNHGTAAGSFTVTMNKADRTAPAAPTLNTATATRIELAAAEGCEYSMDGLTWQDSVIFTGLTKSTQYTFYQRLKETENYNASPSSAAAAISTGDHDHDWSFTVAGATITATCGNTDGGHSGEMSVTMILTAPMLTVYGGTGSPEATVKSGIDGVDTPPVVYKKGETVLAAAPTDAGTYVASITLNGVTASVTYTVAKRSATVTAADKSKTYGDEDPVFTAVAEGTVGDDELLYTIGRAEGENAGEYAITVTPGENPNYDVTVIGAKLTIGKRSATVTAADKSKTYGDEDPVFTAVAEGTVGDDELLYTIGRSEGEDAGEYAITVTPGENPNYDVTVTGAKLTIGTKAVTVSANDLSKAYGTDDPALTVNIEGAVGDDEILYTIAREAGEGLGEYTITVTPGENPNYDVTVAGATFTIVKADAVAATVTANEITGDGTEKALVTVTGKTAGGEMQFALGSDSVTAPEQGWSAQIPVGINAGSYYVWYRVSADANHNDAAAACVSVTIAPDYTVAPAEGLSGESGTQWTRGSKDGFVITVRMSGEDDSFERFVGVKIDGNELVRGEDYTVEKGSTIVTLDPGLSKKLSIGEHAVTVLFDNGEVNTALTIQKKNLTWLWILLTVIALAAVAAVFFLLRRKHTGGRNKADAKSGTVTRTTPAAIPAGTGYSPKRKNNKRTRRAKKNKAKQARKMRKRNS